MSRLRTAVIGCGKVGQTHVQALAALPQSELVAVCDVDLTRAEALGAPYGAEPFACRWRNLSKRSGSQSMRVRRR